MQFEVQAVRGGESALPPDHSFRDFHDMHSALVEDCLAFIRLIEARRIIEPRIVIFRDFMSSRLYDLSSIFTAVFPETLMHSLPVVMEGKVHRAPFSVELWQRSITALEKAEGILDDIIMLTDDFSVEMQNLLLSDVFGQKVLHRVPIDPKRQIVSIANELAIQSSLADTAWGQMCRYAEEQEHQRQALRSANRPDQAQRR